MKTKRALYMAIMALVVGIAHADVPISVYRQAVAIGQVQQAFGKYIVGVGKGIFWANIVMKLQGRKPLFCLPKELALNQDNYISLLDQELKSPTDPQRHYSSDTPIELVLVQALEHTFPCK